MLRRSIICVYDREPTQNKKAPKCLSHGRLFVSHSEEDGTPNGIRTRVTAVKGRCPRPLDDGRIFRCRCSVRSSSAAWRGV